MPIESNIWSGSQENRTIAMDAVAKAEARIGCDEEDKEDDSPRLLSVADGLATITVKGPLVNSDSPYLKYYGVVGYPEIREALVTAVNDPEVKQILLDIDSGGGAVDGCADTGLLIRTANKAKPVTSYGETMASAAYWLGCSAGRVYCGKTSLVGSIGVKATFREYSKANEMEGVTVTVIRAGKHKALADSNEPLTKEARAQIQEVVDAAYTAFVDHVAEMRGVTYDVCHEKMADGQQFIGHAAADCGLTDGISTFDAVVGGIKKKIIASVAKSNHNGGSNRFSLSGELPALSGDSQMAKKALTEADIAALAAGAPLEALGIKPVVIEGKVDGLQTEATAQEVVAEDVVEASVATDKADHVSDQTMQYMQNQLTAKDDAILSLSVKLSKIEDQLTEMQSSYEPIMGIARQAVKNMAVPLNAVAIVSADSTAPQILAEYNRLLPLFISNFPIGGTSAASAETPKKSPAYVMNNVTQAQINAVRGSK